AMTAVERFKRLEVLMECFFLLFDRRYDAACDCLLIPPSAGICATMISCWTLWVPRSGDSLIARSRMERVSGSTRRDCKPIASICPAFARLRGSDLEIRANALSRGIHHGGIDLAAPEPDIPELPVVHSVEHRSRPRALAPHLERIPAHPQK